MGADLTEFAVIRFGVFEIDPKNRELRRRGARVELQPQAFRLLVLLASRPNELVSREQIRSELWPEEPCSAPETLDSRLNFEIKKIRAALGDDADHPRYIKTVRKSGYRFIAPVQVAAARESRLTYRSDVAVNRSVQSEEVQRSPLGQAQPAAEKERVQRLGRLGLRSAGAAAALLATAFLTMWVVEVRRGEEPSPIRREAIRVVRVLAGTGRPAVTSVTPILPQPHQTIVIQGRGFGSHTSFANTDTPYLAIRDQSAHWAAGRIIPGNWDEVMLDVTQWTDTEIIVGGFCGKYGNKGWRLRPGDEIEIAVWNPQTGAGPATYTLRVSPVIRVSESDKPSD
jgi:DNA-binding winged helix-turn-helix (wHTH) protein